MIGATPASGVVDAERARLAHNDRDAWEAYGAACRAGASDEVRQRLYAEAKETMRLLEEALSGAD